MFNYSNSGGFGSGGGSEEQRLVQFFWQVYDGVVNQNNIDANFANMAARNLHPGSILQELQAVINPRTNTYDPNLLARNIMVYLEDLWNSQRGNIPQPQMQQNRPMFTSFQNAGNAMASAHFPRTPTNTQQQAGGTPATLGAKYAQASAKRSEAAAQMQQQPVAPAAKKQAGVIYWNKPSLGDVQEEEIEFEELKQDPFLTIRRALRLSSDGKQRTTVVDALLNYPCMTKIQCIRFMRQNYPQLFNDERWIVNVDGMFLQIHDANDYRGRAGIESFTKAAETVKGIRDTKDFLNVLLPTLRNLKDNKYIHKELLERVNMYLEYYFRNPENPGQVITLEEWSQLDELFKTANPDLLPWAKANPNYEGLVQAFLFGALISMFPYGQNPALDPTKKEHRPIIASIPQFQMSHGKYTLRDYGIMPEETWNLFAKDIEERYVMHLNQYRLCMTSLPKDDAMSDAKITIVTPKNFSSMLHFLNFKWTMDMRTDYATSSCLPLTEIIGCDNDDTMSYDWSINFGQNVDLNLVYFE